jgi:hypothetical protein
MSKAYQKLAPWPGLAPLPGRERQRRMTSAASNAMQAIFSAQTRPRWMAGPEIGHGQKGN